MKKLLLALLIGIAGFGLVACDKEDTPKVDPVVETITLTINFDNGLENQIIEIEKGKTYTFTAPEKENYTFLGWFNGEVEYTDETIFNEDVEVVAKWEKNGGGEEVPVEPEEPVTPVEPETPKEEDKEDEGNVNEGYKEYLGAGSLGVFQELTLNVKGVDKIIIRVLSSSEYANTNVSIDFDNFKVNDVIQEWDITGSSYLTDHEFEIGSLSAIGNLINLRPSKSLGLHTYHKDKGENGFLQINVSQIEEITFSYMANTASALKYFKGISVEFK